MDKLCELIEQQNKIAIANNQLLRKFMVANNHNKDKLSTLSENAETYAGKNLLIIHDSKSKCIEYIKRIAATYNSTIKQFNGKNKSEFVATITSLEKNDLLFIDATNPCFDEELYTILKECVETNSFEVKIGAGSDARDIRLDISPSIYVLYADEENLIPQEIVNLFFKVK